MRTLTILIQLLLGRLTGANRLTVRGRDYHLFPAIAGGAPEGDGDGGDGGDDGDGAGEPAGDGGSDDDDDDIAGLKDEAAREVMRRERKARRDAEKKAADAKKVADDAAAKLKQREDAEKDELTKAQDRVKELEEKDSAKTERLQRANLVAELSKSKYGLADAEVSAKLIEDVEFDDDDKPEGVEDAVKDLLERVPGLAAGAQATGGSAANGNRNGGGGMSVEDAKRLAKENPAKFNQLVDEGKLSMADALGG